MSGKGAGIAAAFIAAGAAIVAALITTKAPICPDFMCGPDKATEKDHNGGSTRIIKVPGPGGKADVAVTPREINCTSEGGCDNNEVRIESVGDATLKVTYMEIKGAGRAYFTADDNCAHKNMAPGVVCSFGVTYTAPASGGIVEARLIIHHNVGADPTTVNLRGEAPIPTDPPTTDPSPLPSDG
ncbi:hypothetical protein AB0M95_39075 [Sphaerisporangium sp. NPDC051017]|uniref:hypothetical protein n=1 Tax=Sphaerisporangium sp. NPDC051017 TaxID=3154636 RepID=UPI0034193D8A